MRDMGRKGKLQRSQSGVGTIVMAMLIGLVAVPLIGLFVFELNRFQFIERQLMKACDAASLAAATRFAEADTTSYSGSNENVRLAMRQLQGIEAGLDIFKQQTIMHVAMMNNASAPSGLSAYSRAVVPRPANPAQPNKCNISIYPVDPNQNYAEVALGQLNGSSMKAEAVFMEEPAFAKYLGLPAVPVHVYAVSGLPRINVFIAIDLSGSMDDATRVTFALKHVVLTPQANQAIQQAAANLPPCPTQCNGVPTTGTMLNAQGQVVQTNPQQQCCQPYNTNPAVVAYNTILNNPQNKMIKYEAVADGRLCDVLQRVGAMPASGVGSAINALIPYNWAALYNYQQLGYFNPGPVSPAAYTSCGNPGSTFTDVVVNFPGQIVDGSQLLTHPQPVFGPARYVGGADTSGFAFPDLATAVEAGRGTLDSNNGWQQAWGPYYAVTKAQLPSEPAPHSGYQAAYMSDAAVYTQPIGTALFDTAQMIQAMEGSKNINFAIAGFSTATASAPAAPLMTNTSTSTSNPSSNLPQDGQQGTGQNWANNPPLSFVGQDPAWETPALKQNYDGVPFIAFVAGNDSTGLADMERNLMNLHAQQGTDMGATLQKIHDFIASRPECTAPGTKNVIVLITDGLNSAGSSPVSVVQNWGPPAVPIYAIGLAMDNTVLQSQKVLLQQIVDADTNQGAPSYYAAPTGATETLANFLNVARQLTRLQQ